ncbi:glycosyltransferase 61 family protein [Pseudomonas sp. 51_B]|uniref:glycosyltransferase family 61 protein n=1 Tax=Pseudomonas sp. 51_B TaxID=2813573 RepID=UPI001A9E70C7|nr:glycosyltransferase 61 family protein [Pseudomonas sp. 51_B]
MTKVISSVRFDIADSFNGLINSSSDAVFVEQESAADYKTNSSRHTLTAPHETLSDLLASQSGCSFLQEVISIPSLLVHKLHCAAIYPGKIRLRKDNWHKHGQLVLTSNNALFPGSYGVMDGRHTLPSDLLTPSDTKGNYRLLQSKPKKFLKGHYLFLGSMHDHFGHFLVEGLARLWILKYFTDIELTNLRIIIYEPGLIPPATKILEYLGINKSQFEFLSEPCIVESLIAPGVGYCTHLWARDVMNFVFDRVANAAISERATNFPKKVFFSRNNVPARKLKDELALESIYREAGYWILRPEELPIGDQIRIAANADSIAGCTGSNMYLALFQKPHGNNHVYAPFDFTLKDDAIISQLRNSRLHYVVGSRLSANQWTLDTTSALKILKDQA